MNGELIGGWLSWGLFIGEMVEVNGDCERSIVYSEGVGILVDVSWFCVCGYLGLWV